MFVKLPKKRIFFFLTFLIVGSMAVVYYTPRAYSYLEFKKVEAAIGTSPIPFQDAGNWAVVKKCVIDAPLWTCNATCPFVTNVLVAACSSEISGALGCISASGVGACGGPIAKAKLCVGCEQYFEAIPSLDQKGTPFYGIPMTFTNYKGGGVFPPKPGQYIWGGTNNMIPYVLGTPQMASIEEDSLSDSIKSVFDFVIAGFKDDE